ncbi:hypothetical protein ABT288_36485 [Streptomyces sp. NPDC001093]|uniref:hypothetical protein n=1 Tax=Streptomyces sp. NPDC001093 TaxID=3154376 RepID=UPI003328A539
MTSAELVHADLDNFHRQDGCGNFDVQIRLHNGIGDRRDKQVVVVTRVLHGLHDRGATANRISHPVLDGGKPPPRDEDVFFLIVLAIAEVITDQMLRDEEIDITLGGIQ